MRFELSEETKLFAESTRAAIGDWEAPREPELGGWQDDRDESLTERLAKAGWEELWKDDELLAATVAGGLELGRAVAPVCVIDEATLSAPLAVAGRARHGLRASAFAVPLRDGGLTLAQLVSVPAAEATLDGSGTVRVDTRVLGQLEPIAAAKCWRAWNAATLAYFAGLAAGALDLAVEHARARKQFGAPIAALPAVQSRLADAALAVDALQLLAWVAAGNREGLQPSALLWAGATCSEVTASAHQVHGAVGFALETGLHRYHRRARSLQTWTAAVCWEARTPPPRF